MSQSELQLKKRSEELDAQQRYIDSQLEIIKSGPLTVKQIEAQIAVKQEQLSGIMADILTAATELDEINEANRRELRSQATQRNQRRDELSVLEQTLTSRHQDIQTATKELKNLAKDIADRQIYQEHQEADISRAIEAGQDHLSSLKIAAKALDDDILALKLDKTALEADVDDLKLEKDRLVIEVLASEADLAAVTTKHQATLEGIQSDTQTATQKLAKLDQTYTTKITELTTKEASIKAKLDELALESQRIKEERRRWDNTKSMYEI